jgi:hypothetical protein
LGRKRKRARIGIGEEESVDRDKDWREKNWIIPDRYVSTALTTA